MGAWGVDNFANDDALDWVADLEAEGVEAVGAAVADVLALDGDYLEAPVAARALAAAEVIAALGGRPARELPEPVAAWIADHAGPLAPELRANARLAVARVLADSELQELWAESEDSQAWAALVADLQVRLS